AQGPTERAAELALLIVQRAAERVGRRQRLFTVVVERLTVDGVRSRLRHDVDESAVRPPDFHRRAAPYHLEFSNRGLREEEHPLVAAALIALQRIVEVDAVDGDVRVDRSLARD